MRNLYVIVVVVLSVLIGFIYYWSDVRENTIDGSGTLVYWDENVLWD